MGKIITVWSHKNNMGVTFTATNLALSMAKEQKDKKVLLLDLNFSNPQVLQYLVLNQDNKNINNILSYAISEKISEENIINNSDEVEGLFVVKGNKAPTINDITDYKKIEIILDNARNYFDYIIVDVNSYVNYSATYAALDISDIVLHIAKRETFNMLSYNMSTKEIYRVFNYNKFYTIFNNDTLTMDTSENEIMELIDLQILGSLPTLSNIGKRLAKFGIKNIKSKEMQEYNNGMKHIINFLLDK